MPAKTGGNRYPRVGERLVPTVLREFLTYPVPGMYLRDKGPAEGKDSGRGMRLCDLDEGAWERFSAEDLKELSGLVIRRVNACQAKQDFLDRRFPRPPKGTRLDSLRMENRTRGCLERDGFDGDLEQLGDRTLGEILSIRAFGPRCLVDLLIALEVATFDRSSDDSDQFSADVVREAKELAKLTEASRIAADDPRFGRVMAELDLDAGSVGELASGILAKDGNVPDPRYVLRRLRELRESITQMPSLTLEEELTAIFAPADHQRNSDILIEYYGWRDGRQKTLTAVGEEFGITRERVRQVCSKLTRRHKDVSSLVAPVMDSALRFIEDSLPCSAAGLEAELARRGITGIDMALDTVLTGAKLLKRPVDVEITNIGEKRMSVRPKQLNAMSAISDLAKKESYFHGLSTVDSIRKAIERKFPEAAADELVRETLPLLEGFRWLDQKSGWFRLHPISKHGLPKGIDKVLSVAGKVTSSELREALGRNRRMWDEPPPRAVILEFCRQMSGVRVEGNRIIADPPRDWRQSLTGVEARLVEVLKENGGVMDRGDMEDVCVDAGMNRFSFHAFLSWSPVINQLGHSLYGLLGTRISRRKAEKMAASRREQRAAHRVLDSHGRTEDGKVWLSYHLSKAASTYAVITIPAALKDIVKGQFELLDEQGTPMGTLATRDGRAWGLGSLMRQKKAQVGDRVVVTLDLEKRVATVAMDDGESDGEAD